MNNNTFMNGDLQLFCSFIHYNILVMENVRQTKLMLIDGDTALL